MNKSILTLSALAILVLIAAVYGAQVAQAHSVPVPAPQDVDFKDVLGKPLIDQVVTEFITSNGCVGSRQVVLCEDAGMALLFGTDGLVETVYLYPASIYGIRAYRGELPFRLSADDTMASVEQKLGAPKVIYAPQAGWLPGLPDESTTPDHVHLWAAYKRFGMTAVYNSPSASDKGATILAILISK